MSGLHCALSIDFLDRMLLQYIADLDSKRFLLSKYNAFFLVFLLRIKLLRSHFEKSPTSLKLRRAAFAYNLKEGIRVIEIVIF